MKILAVDDDDSIRTLITMILADAGYDHVSTAASAGEALAVIGSETAPFDCLLLDIQMPDRDGIMLCKDIRQLEGYEKSAIIMLTAMHEHSYVTEAFKSGATDYITKPFDITDLCTRVKLAEFLVERQRGQVPIQSDVQRPAGGPAHELDRRLTEKAELLGIDGLLPADSFKNYLGQLSRTGLQMTKVFAIRIEKIEFLIDRCSAPDFEDMVRHTADAIAEACKTAQLSMTYAGHGTFVAASHSAAPLVPDDVERKIQYILDERDLSFANGDPLDIDVAVGSAVAAVLNSANRTDMIIERAIERAVARMDERARRHRPISIKSV